MTDDHFVYFALHEDVESPAEFLAALDAEPHALDSVFPTAAEARASLGDNLGTVWRVPTGGGSAEIVEDVD